MITCNSEMKTATYGSELFCRICGMDIGLNPIRISHSGEYKVYCCEECAKTK